MSGLDPHRCSPVELRMEAARRLGCEVVSLDPQTGFLHQIRRGDRSRVLMGALSPLNDAAASRLASDKFHTATVLARDGLRVPEGVRCLRPGRFRTFGEHTGLTPALALADAHGFPLVTKPNGGSCGRGVGLVHDREALTGAIEDIWQDDYLALVQRPVPGRDLRVDLLDERCIAAYQRGPLVLRGDGRRSVGELMQAADARLSPAWCAAMLPGDPQWQRAYHAGLRLNTVLSRGQTVDFDATVLNLNRLCVGQWIDPVPEPWRRLARRIGHRLGLRHFGVDMKVESLDQDPSSAVIIEVNASPSLGNTAMHGDYERVIAIEQDIVRSILAMEVAGPPPAEAD